VSGRSLERDLPRRTSLTRSLLDRLTFSHSEAPGALYRRVRLAQALLPVLIVAVVVVYQLLVVRLESRSAAFWAELLFYGILGPLVTYFVLGWIGLEVSERERAERDLRALYLELSESHARLAAVQKVTRNVSEATDLGSVLETAISSLTEAVGATGGAIALEGGVVRSVGLDELPLEVLDLQPLREANATLERPSGASGAKNRLSLPLRWGDRFLGAVHLYFAGMPRAESRELLEILVGELAVAIEAASIRTRDLLTLFEVDRSIRAESNLERLLEGVLSRIQERVRAESSAVYLADEDERLTLAWGRDAKGETVRAGLEHGWSVGNLARLAAERREPLLVGDLEREPTLETGDGERIQLARADDPVLDGARTALALPMMSENELIGVIVLADSQANAFDIRELPLLGLLANQVTLAVRNARAYLYSEELAILDERNRIAREIHDGIAQSLAFTAMKLDLAERILERDPERVKRELVDARTTLREQIKEVRRSIFALRPLDLERLGFLETVRQYVKDFGEQNSVKTTLEITGEPKLSPTNEAVMFRILQEALNNIAKHSKARHTTVGIADGVGTGIGATLTVTDDGVGFDPSALTGVVSSVGGLGLGQMRERVEARGGRFEFTSSLGAGTRVFAQVP
jgi:signal transduction histidine kinase